MEKYIQYIVYEEEFDTPEFDVGYHLWNGKAANEHSHNYYEFFIVLNNSILHRCNGTDKVLLKNTLRFIRPNDIHGFFQYKKMESQHMNFASTPALMEKLIDSLSSNILRPIIYSDREIEIVLTESELNFFINLSQRINLSDAANHEAKSAITKTMLLNALYIILSRTNNQIADIPDWFRTLLEKINSAEMLSNNISDIYKLSHYSHAMLINYFKKYTGDTIIQYLTKVKINYACNLLEKTNFTTLDIASKIGFDSLSHFNRVFKKLVGKAPKEYRKSIAQTVIR